MSFLRNCFVVLLLPLFGAHAQTVITLSAPSPTSGLPGVTAVSVNGTGLPTGTVSAASTTITLQPATLGAGPTAAIPPSSVTSITGGRRFTFTLPAGLAVSTATPYTISIAGTTSTNNAFSSGNQPAITLNPPAVSLFTLTPASVTGGLSSTGKVTINAPTPSGGIDVILGGGTAFLVLPASVHIPETATSATFMILTAPVVADTVAPLSATYNSVPKNANLTVLAPAVSSVQLTPATLIGSASSTANKVVLTGPTPAGGLDVQLQSDLSAAAPPTSVHVPDGTTQATFSITTSPVASIVAAHITASLGASSKQATLTLTPISVSALSLASTTVGGTALTATVSLNAPAAGSDAVVQLTTSNATLLSIPSTVTIPVGTNKSAAIPVTTQPVTAPTLVHVTATYGGVTKNVDVTINPPSLISLALSPAAVLGNISTTGNHVTLNGPAPAGGITVGIASADPVNAIVPASVSVPAGSTQSPPFTIDTKAVPAQTVVAITATQGSISKSANLTLNPIIVQTVTLSPATIASGLTTTANKITLNGAAPTGGSVVVFSTDTPALVSLPLNVTIPAGQTTSAVFTISTNWTNTQKVAKIIATLNGVSKSANLTINPTSLTTLTLSPASVIGSVDTAANTVKLDSPAPAGGAAVSLTSSNPQAASVPPTVTVLEGQTVSAPFTIQTFPVSSNTPATITAAYVAQRVATLTVKPILITSLTLSPAKVAGGLASTGNKVTINSPAPAGGTVIALASGNGIATIAPPSITVLPGQTVSPQFTISTNPVGASTIVPITATLNGASKTTNLTVAPGPTIDPPFPDHAAAGATLTVALSGNLTNWKQGSTKMSFGAGISVNGAAAGTAGAVTVLSAESAIASLVIAAGAAPGSRTVSVTTAVTGSPTESETLLNGFTVTAGAQVNVTLAANTIPVSGTPGTSMAVAGSNFPASTILSNGVTLRFAPLVSGAGPTVTADSVAVSPNVSGTRQVSFLVPSSLVFSASTPYLVTLAGETTDGISFSSSNFAAVTISASPNVTPVAEAGSNQAVNVGTTVNLNGTGSTDPALETLSYTWSFLTRPAASAATLSDIHSPTPTFVADLAGNYYVQLVVANLSQTSQPDTVVITAVPATPVISVVTPGAGQAGTSSSPRTVDVAIVGKFTHFDATSSIAITGIDTKVTIALKPWDPNQGDDALHRRATITIQNAAAGARTVTVTTDTESASLSGAFVVTTSAALSFASIQPASCLQGETILVQVTGNNTHFAQGVTKANFGDSIAIGGISVDSPTQATIPVTCGTLAPLGSRTVTVVTGGEFALATNGFAVTSGGVSITQVSPNAGPQNSNATVSLVGDNTHWVQSGTTVSFGSGINVGNITVDSPTSLHVDIAITPGAVLGTRSITATTNGEVAAINNAFTVTAGTPFISGVAPASGTQGTNNLHVVATATFFNWLATATANFGPNITVNGPPVVTSGGAFIDFSISISPTAGTGSRNVTITNGAADFSFPFTVLPSAATITLVSPTSGKQGNSYALHVTGSNTHWVQGTTTASFASGISVNRIIVNTSGTAELDITISPGQPAGATSFSMATGGEVVGSSFTVLPATPSCTIQPMSGMIGTAVPVQFICQYSHLGPGTLANIDGNGVAIQSFTTSGSALAYATFNISASAPSAPALACGPGNRTVTLTTGTEILTMPFCVNSTPAVLSGVNPYHSPAGQTLAVTISGRNTHFNQCPSGLADNTHTQVGFGPNTTWTCSSVDTAQQTVTGQLTIDAAAATGWRQAFVNTGSEQVSIGFLIDEPPSGTPATLLSASPSSGAQGQTLTVTIKGSGTNFTATAQDPANNTVAILGQGITVNSLTIVSSTEATAVVQIGSTTPTGPRGVSMISGSEVVTAPLFSVTAGIAALSAVTPSSVTQGDVVPFHITGSNSHFLQGATTVNFGSGIIANVVTVNSPTDITGQISVGFSAPTGFRGISATTEGETAASSSSALLVNESTPAGLNYTPITTQQGTSLNLLLNGLGTTWVNGVTTATFGSNNGLVVNAVNVTSPTQATLSLTVKGTASVGLYTLTVTTDHGGGNIEQITVPNSFTVAQGAAIITNVSPNQGTQSTTLPITVAGQNTNFQAGVTTARFVLGGCGSGTDPGINVTNVAVVDATHATLSIAISSTAQTGLRTLCLATLGENVGFGNAFTVLSATPTLNGVSPVSGAQGQSLTLNIIGQFTHWVQGVTTATFGQGITVQSLAIDPNGTAATAVVLIDPLAFTGGRTVTITTNGEIVSGNLFSVMAGPAILSSMTPSSANQGTQNLQIQILGQNTHWAQGITQFSMTGANFDLTVNGFQVQNATSAIAEISLSPTANLGTRTIFLSTGGENVALNGGFLVTGGIPAITQVSPSTLTQGNTSVNVQIAGAFTQWTGASTNVGIDFPADLTLGQVTVNSFTSITAVLSVSPSAALGLHTISIQTGSQVLTARINVLSSFTPPPSPSISWESPGVALAGQTLNVYFAGQYTHWLPGSTDIVFGPGITLNNFQVTGLGSAVANVTIPPDTSIGSRAVTITTGSEVLNSSFSVTVGTPAIVVVDPGSIIQGQTRDVDIVGQYTTFNSGTVFSFETGITVNSVQIFSATSARVNIMASPTAATGLSTVTATGAEIVSHGFTVTPGQAVITSVSPNTALQGTAINVAVTGFGTHWSGVTTFSFGGGIAVSNINVTSNTAATMTLTLAALAATGIRSASASTAGETAVLSNAFVVQPGTPILLSSTPSSAQQGASFSLGILGQYTAFNGATTVNLGAGALNILVTPTSANSLTVTGSIDPLAFTGLRNVVVTTGTQVLTLFNAFSITPGPAAIASLNPTQGKQGQSLNVAVTGVNTHFNAATAANFGAGISVGILNVTDAQHATAPITIAAGATPGLRSVSVTTQGETASAASVFTVIAATPVINFISPTSSAQGQTLNITVNASFTSFINGTTTSSFGPGITVNSTNVTGNGAATINVTVSPIAALGLRSLTMTTNTEVVTLASAFTVTAGPATILSVSPNQGRRGTNNLALTVTGSSTHFDATTTAACSGTGVTVVSVTPGGAGLEATVVVNIDPAAALGQRNLTVSTGGEILSFVNAFNVQPALLTITTSSLPNGTTGTAYSQTIGVNGGASPFNFIVSVGSLPSNLVLNATSGALTGTPAASGTTSFTIQVTDSSSQTASVNLTLTVHDPLTISTTTLSAGVSGVAYSQTVIAAGGVAPRTFALHAGTLPAGVSLDAATGVIAGTPTVTGAFSPTVRVTDNVGQFVDRSYSFTIYAALSFTTTTVANGRRTFAYNQAIVFNGGVPTATLSLNSGSLPNGVTASGNSLTGTPAESGQFTFQLKMTDAAGNFAVQDYTLTISEILSISSTSPLPTGVVGVNYSQTIATADGVAPVTFAQTGGMLPTSLTLNLSSGQISGIPTVAGDFTFTIQATDSLNLTASRAFTITIAPPPLITTINPNQSAAGGTAAIAITGHDTHFVNGTTTASFGAGVTVNSVTVSSPTAASISITVDSNAAAGARDVTLTTGTEISRLVNGFSIVNSPPLITGIAPTGARKNTTASITVSGQSLLGATFQFQNPIPNVTSVPTPITVVSNDGATAVLSFPTGADEGQFALVATTTIGSSPITNASQFIVQPAGAQSVLARPASVLNIFNTWNNVPSIPAGRNSAFALSASVLNINNTWNNVPSIPAGRNTAFALSASVLNISTTWNNVPSIPAGRNSAFALSASVLNIINTWNNVPSIPVGRNTAISLAASVQNILWDNSLRYVPPIGRSFAGALPVGVCNRDSGCPGNPVHALALTEATVEPSAVRDGSLVPPSLGPVESLETVVEGRTLRLQWIHSSLCVICDGPVDYEVNGVIVGRTEQAPHEFLFTVPAGVRELTFRAISGSRASRLVRMLVTADEGAAVDTPQPADGETVTLAASGLKAEIFSFRQSLTAPPALDELTPKAVGYVTAINQTNPRVIFGDDPLGAGIDHDFAIRYTGELWADGDGIYRFWLTARSGAVLKIDGKPASDEARLVRGWHQIEIEYYLAAGAESLLLEWQQPGEQRQVLGPEFLRTGLDGNAARLVPLKFDNVWIRIQKEGSPTREILARDPQGERK